MMTLFLFHFIFIFCMIHMDFLRWQKSQPNCRLLCVFVANIEDRSKVLADEGVYCVRRVITKVLQIGNKQWAAD